MMKQGKTSPSTPARRPWTVDEQKKLDDLMETGKTAAEIATALQRTPPPFIRGYSAFTENDRSHPPPGRDGLKGESTMKAVCALVGFSVALAGCADMRGTVRVEQASADKPYDFVVHVKNSAEIGYNPEVSGDRAGMAVAIVKRYCPAPRVVGQEKIITEIYGITSSKPDYLVFVSCHAGLKAKGAKP